MTWQAGSVTGPDGIAFIEEDLDIGPRRRYPRWLGPLVGVVVVVVAVTGLLTNGAGIDHKPAPTATGVGPPSDGAARAMVGVPDRGEFVEVVGDRLQILRADGTRIHRSSPVSAVENASDTVVLDVDAAANTVWVVTALDNKAEYAESYSLDHLHLRYRVKLLSPIRGSAAVGGRLYILQAQTLTVLDRAGTRFDPVLLSGYVQSIAADPSRHRLLAAVGSGTGALELIPLRGSTPGPASEPLPGNPTAVAVAGETIWIDNYTQLISLDPVTFAARSTVPVLHSGGGIRLMDAGDSSLFLRPVESEDPLECVDATTGRQLQYWPNAPGIVAATRHRALVAPILGPAKNLKLTTCAG